MDDRGLQRLLHRLLSEEHRRVVGATLVGKPGELQVSSCLSPPDTGFRAKGHRRTKPLIADKDLVPGEGVPGEDARERVRIPEGFGTPDD